MEKTNEEARARFLEEAGIRLKGGAFRSALRRKDICRSPGRALPCAG